MNKIVKAGLFECLILEIISEMNEVRAIYKKEDRMVRKSERRERKSVSVKK